MAFLNVSLLIWSLCLIRSGELLSLSFKKPSFSRSFAIILFGGFDLVAGAFSYGEIDLIIGPDFFNETG